MAWFFLGLFVFLFGVAGVAWLRKRGRFDNLDL